MNPAGLLEERMTLKSFAPFLILLLNVITSQTHSCEPYEYWTPNGCCPMCKPGQRVYKDCTESSSTLCDPCTNGTFMDQLNPLPECNNCRKCDEAAGLKTKTSCTTVSDTVCEPVEGFNCSESKKDDCVKATNHTRCKPGEYISINGTSSTDTECSPCPNGTFSDGTSPSCQNHTRTALIILSVALFVIGLGLVIGLVCCHRWKFLKNRQQKRQSVLYNQGRVTSEDSSQTSEELKELKVQMV